MNEQTAREVKGLIQENTGTINIHFGAPVDSSTSSERHQPAPVDSSTVDFTKHHLGELLKKSQFKQAQKEKKTQISHKREIVFLTKELEAEKQARQELEAELMAVKVAQQELAHQLQLLRNLNEYMRENFKGK
jgi:glutamine phosphoribosylpyrophosphate amidotransferase